MRKILSRKKNKAQLLLMGGVIISVLLLSTTLISVHLPNIIRQVDKDEYIKSRYGNIKEEFGRLLKNKLKDNVRNITEDNYEYFEVNFEHARDIFVSIEKSHNNFFEVECDYDKDLIFGYEGYLTAINVTMIYNNQEEFIREEIRYEIT